MCVCVCVCVCVHMFVCVAYLCRLRASKAPDETADMGQHSFTYALMPHGGMSLN